MADKIDIVLAQQVQASQQLASLIDRTAEHGATLAAVTGEVRRLHEEVSEVRKNTVECRARTEFPRVETAVAGLTEKLSKRTPKNGIIIPDFGSEKTLARLLIYVVVGILGVVATWLGVSI